MSGCPKQMEPPAIRKIHNYGVTCPVSYTHYGRVSLCILILYFPVFKQIGRWLDEKTSFGW